MKKLLLLITGLLLLFSVEGQILRYGNPTASTPPEEDTTNYYSEFLPVYYAMTVKPGHDTAHIYSDMVYSLDSLGVWDRTDFLHVYAMRSNANGEAYLNWVDPGTFDCTVPTNAPTFTKYVGINGNATDQYLTTNYTPSDDAINVSLNSVTLGIYVLDNIYSTSKYSIGAVYDSPSLHRLAINPAYGNLTSPRYYTNTGTQIAGVLTEASSGLHLATRRGATDAEAYHRGVSVGTNTAASIALPGVPIFVCAVNSVGNPGSFDDRRIAMDILYDATDDTEAAAVDAIIERCMRRIGIGVQ